MCARLRLCLVVLGTLLVPSGVIAQAPGPLAPWVPVTVTPDPRGSASIAYDASRGILVMFGGFDEDSDYNDTWTFDGHVWTPVTVYGPSGLDSAPMAYDPALSAVVLVDPNGGTWTFNGTTWTNVATCGGQVSGSSMAYLPSIGKLVLLATDGQTWLFDGTVWTAFPVSGPPGRSRAGMVYDAHLRRVVLFGGYGAGEQNDTWTFDGTTWTQLTPESNPPGRQNAVLVYDPIRVQTILFGGSTTSSSLSDTWAFDGTTWTALTPPLSPSPRCCATGDFMASTGKAAIFGGYLDSTRNTASETWTWDGGTWAQTATPPGFVAVTTDPSTGRLLGVGGDGTTWRWDGSTWVQAPVPALSSVYGAALATDAAHHRVVLLASGGTSWMWTWDGSAWTQATPTTVPPIRYSAMMTWDPVRQVIVLFGGFDLSGNALNDTWTWDGTTWTQATPSVSPGPRGQAGLAWDPSTSSVLLYGGVSGYTNFNDTWRWDGSAWTQVPTVLPAQGAASLALDTDLGQPVLLDSGAQVWAWNGTGWYGQTNAGLPVGILGFSTSTHQLVDAGTTTGTATWISSGAVGTVHVSLLLPTLLADGLDSTLATAQVTDVGGRPAPGLPVLFEASGGQTVGPVTDQGDGIYTATLTSSLDVGSFTLTARSLTVAGQTTFAQSGQQVVVSTSSLDFGRLGLGVTSPTLVVTVTSTGTMPVYFTASTLSGASPGDFAIVSDGCRVAAQLLKGGTCQVSLTFTPTQTGVRSATLAINDSAPGAPHMVSLGGTGVNVSLSPAAIDFGAVTQGVLASPVSVTVTNDSSDTVTVTSLTFSGANPGDFSTSGDTCTGTGVAPNSSCTFSVAFTPQGVGARSATLAVASSSPDSPATLGVAGTGVAVVAAGSVGPSAFTFSQTTVGATSAATTVTLTSTGTGPLSVTGVAVGGQQPLDFVVTVDGCTGAMLAPGLTCTVSVAFAPKAVCGSSATLTFTDTGGTRDRGAERLRRGGANRALPVRALLHVLRGRAPGDGGRGGRHRAVRRAWLALRLAGHRYGHGGRGRPRTAALRLRVQALQPDLRA